MFINIRDFLSSYIEVFLGFVNSCEDAEIIDQSMNDTIVDFYAGKTRYKTTDEIHKAFDEMLIDALKRFAKEYPEVYKVSFDYLEELIHKYITYASKVGMVSANGSSEMIRVHYYNYLKALEAYLNIELKQQKM